MCLLSASLAPAQFGGGAKEDRGLLFDQVEISVFIEIGFETAVDLKQFAFADQAAGARENLVRSHIVEAAENFKGAREEDIASHHRRFVAPLGVDRGHAAPCFGIVENVVVAERGEVNHLDQSSDVGSQRRLAAERARA